MDLKRFNQKGGRDFVLENDELPHSTMSNNNSKREKSLIVNTVTLSIGKFFPKLMAFITLPILTGYLTKIEYGTYDLISTLVSLLIPVATLQIQSAAFRFLIDHRKDKEASSVIISSIFAVTLPITLVTSLVVQFFFSEFNVHVRLLITAYFFLDTIHLTVGQISRGLGDNKSVSKAAIILSCVYTISMIVGVRLSKTGLLGVIFALALAQLISTAYLIVKTHLFSYLSIRYISKDKIKEMLQYSWPMVPNNLSAWVLKLSDRLVITAFLGIEFTAIYAVANKIPHLLAMAQSVMVMAWQENATIASKDEDADIYYSRMFDYATNLMFSFTTIIIACTPFLFKILVRGNYLESYYHMPVLTLAMYFSTMSSFFGGIFIAHKKTVVVGMQTVVAAIINLAIDLASINIIGVWAGTISTLIAYLFLFYYRMYNCKKIQKMSIDYKKQVAVVLILTAMILLCYIRKPLFEFINGLIAIVLAFIYNKDLLNSIWRKIKRMLKK